MATVALGPVGAHPTLSSGAWRRATTRWIMLSHRIADRFTAWLRVETRVDRYASYAALACALLATVLVVL